MIAFWVALAIWAIGTLITFIVGVGEYKFAFNADDERKGAMMMLGAFAWPKLLVVSLLKTAADARDTLSQK